MSSSPSIKDLFQQAQHSPAAAPPSPVPALTPRPSNLPQPAVFASTSAKHARSNRHATADNENATSTSVAKVVLRTSDADVCQNNDDLPTPTFRGTPPVTPFLTQRRGGQFVVAASPLVPTTTKKKTVDKSKLYNTTGLVPTLLTSAVSPASSDVALPSPPTTVQFLSPSELTPNTVRHARNFQPTPAAHLIASVRKPTAAPPADAMEAEQELQQQQQQQQTTTIIDVDVARVLAAAPTSTVQLSDATLSFYELQRREVAQRREIATAKKAQRGRRIAAEADTTASIPTSLSMAAAPHVAAAVDATTNKQPAGAVRRQTRPALPRVPRPPKPAAQPIARGRARTQIEEAINNAAGDVQRQYQLEALPAHFVEQVEVASDGQSAKYTIASHTYNVMMRGRKCMVRTGGGWVAIATFLAEALERAHEALIVKSNPTMETKRARSRSRSRSRPRAPVMPAKDGAFGCTEDDDVVPVNKIDNDADHNEDDDEDEENTEPLNIQPEPVVTSAPKRHFVSAVAAISEPNSLWRLEIPPPASGHDFVGSHERQRFSLDAFPVPFQSGDAAEQLAQVYDCFFDDAGNDDVQLTLDELRSTMPDFSEEKLEIFLELLESRHLIKAIAVEFDDGEAQLAWQRTGL